MRKNLPVSNNEVVMRDDQVIISSTDLKGRITEVDQDFIEISGFSREELIGKNHNIIRHPDMPAPAFQWLWDTIQAGKPWSGLVKNRCKNGNFYWVAANVTPIIEQGHITGYLSVRSKPARADIEAAGKLYADINSGKVILGKKTLLQKINIFSGLKIWQRMAGTILLMAMLLTGSWWITLEGLSTSHASLLLSGNDRIVALAAAKIESSILAIMVDLKKTQTILEPAAYDHSHQFMLKKLDVINKDIHLIESDDLGARERVAATAYIKAIHAYINGTLLPVKIAMQPDKTGEYDDATFNSIVIALNNKAFQTMEKLGRAFHATQAKVISGATAKATSDYTTIRDQSLISVGVSLLLAFVSSLMLILNITRRLRYTTEKFGSIAEGNYFDWVKLDSNDEIGVLQEGLKSMQIRGGYAMRLIKEQAAEALSIKESLDQIKSPVIIADVNYKIFYANAAANEMFHTHENDFRCIVSDFNADKVAGQNIDSFYKDPDHQRRILANLQASETSDDMPFCDEFIVRLTASPVHNEAGDRIATVVEWVDRSIEIAAEKEVGQMVTSVQRGDFSVRINRDGKKGFFAALTDGLNELTETVDRAVEDTIGGLRALEQGDLTHRINAEYEGAFDTIKQASNNTTIKLADVIGNVSAAAEEVGIGTGEIAEGNNTLNSRTQEQAAALEETAASIEEITGTVQQTSDNARQANQLAVDARTQAENGGAVAQRAVSAMAEINASSHKISDIISVIDEIAFQTNLLALNAAVEAARAGEQGRGFAVVAAEVRSLAQRSAEAAKEIKVLINQSVSAVEGGSKLVDETGSSLNEIVASVGKVSNIIAEIAAASVEQTAGIDQINKAIAQLDSGTQQNTAMVEESAAASQRLSEQAAALRSQVSIFNLSSV